MKHIFLLFLLLLCFSTISAQMQISVKATPQNIFHPQTAIMPLALEFRKNRFAIEYEHGFPINSFFLDWNRGKNSQRYFRSRLGLQYRMQDKSVNYTIGKLQQFLGIYASYMPERYNRTNNWYIRDSDDRTYTYESANVSIKYWKYYICYGLKISFSEVFCLEYLFGLGGQHKKVDYDSSNDILAVSNIGFWGEWFTTDKTEGISNAFFPAFNMRLVFQLFSVENEKVEGM
ncbi:MAG: hypothetical protein ACPG5B_11315 [Chitinophagales bacterium]